MKKRKLTEKAARGRTPLDAKERKLAEVAARVIVKAAEIGLPDAPGQLVSPHAIRFLARAYVELLEGRSHAPTGAPIDDPRVELYRRAMGSTIDFSKHATFVVRQWDGGYWCDCTGDVSRDEALRDWSERTGNGTRNIAYAEINYYAIFPGGTHMLWNGSDGKEMHRP